MAVSCKPNSSTSMERRNIENPQVSISSKEHPLQYTWCFYYYRTEKTKSWEENLIKSTRFSTVEGFWRVLRAHDCVTKLSKSYNYAIFKEGLRPVVEDIANINGGKWAIKFDRKEHTLNLDSWWLDTILLMIGDNFTYSRQIHGAVMHAKANVNKMILSIWTRDKDKSKEEVLMPIGEKWRNEVHTCQDLVYMSLSDNLTQFKFTG